MREGEYFGTHWYWDEEDREYTLCATWFFEKNYPEMPDNWILQSIEVEDQEPGSPELDLMKGGNVWNAVEQDGPPKDLQEVDYV